MLLDAIVLFVKERTHQIKELSMIDSYIILFSTFPQGDIWTRAEQLENWNEQVKESGGVKWDQSQMAALLLLDY